MKENKEWLERRTNLEELVLDLDQYENCGNEPDQENNFNYEYQILMEGYNND